MTRDELLAIPGVPEEFEFWKGFVKSAQFATWLAESPTPELRPEVIALLQTLPGKVLDVGSGAVSVLNGTVPKDRLFSTDLLSPLYQEIFDYAAHGITPPFAVPAEQCGTLDKYQAVHIRNALDHCQDPAKAFEAMVSATKRGGYVIVSCFENEADYMRGIGMHSWNIFLSEAQLILNRRGSFSSVTLAHPKVETLSSFVANLDNGRRWVTWIGRKA